MGSSDSKTKGKAKSTARNKKPVAPTKARTRKANAVKSPLGEDEIRNKAQEIYNERILRREHGTAEDDWLRAERLLKG
jgi:hypothetical protein